MSKSSGTEQQEFVNINYNFNQGVITYDNLTSEEYEEKFSFHNSIFIKLSDLMTEIDKLRKNQIETLKSLNKGYAEASKSTDEDKSKTSKKSNKEKIKK